MKLSGAQRRFLICVWLARENNTPWPFGGLNKQTAESLERKGLLQIEWDDEDGGDKFRVRLSDEGLGQMVAAVRAAGL